MPVPTVILAAAALAQLTTSAPSLPSLSAIPQPRAKISLRYAGREAERPVPFEVVKGVIVFKLTVAGREASAILDNGAQQSLLDEAFARAAGLEVGAPDGAIVTLNGSAPKRRVSKVPLSIPGAFETEVPAMATMDMAALSRIVGRKIDFVFGADFFGTNVLAIDPARRMLRIGPRGGARLPPTIPAFDLSGERPHIQVLVNDRPVSLEVDLGSNDMLVLTPEAWARVGEGVNSGMSVRNRDVTDHTKSTQVQIERLPQIKLGPIQADNVTASIKPWPISQGDGSIGYGLLQRYLVIIDAGVNRMWLARPVPAP